MTAFVFSLVLLLGVILFWAFKRLWTGLLVGLPLEGPRYAGARGSAGASGVARATSAGVGPGAATSPGAIRSGTMVFDARTSSRTPGSAARGATTPATTAESAAPLGPTSPTTAGAGAAQGVSPAAPVAASPPAASPPAAAPAAQSPSVPGPAAPADNLRRMVGIGPVNDRRLKEIGVTSFAQIAAWTPEDVKRVEAVLAFDGRIARERWIEQAKYLAAGDQAGFLRAFPAAGRDGNT